MFVVMVMFKRQGQCQFLFDKYDHANRAATAVRDAARQTNGGKIFDVVELMDDYGTWASIDSSDVQAVILQNPQRHLEGAQGLVMINKRAEALFQKRAANDPALRFMVPGGPSPGFPMS